MKQIICIGAVVMSQNWRLLDPTEWLGILKYFESYSGANNFDPEPWQRRSRLPNVQMQIDVAPASSILAKAVEIMEVLYKYLNIRMDPFPGSIELYYLFITFHSDLLLWFITVPGMVQLIGYGRSMATCSFDLSLCREWSSWSATVGPCPYSWLR